VAGAGKGEALTGLLDSEYRGVSPVYLADELAGEAGFEAFQGKALTVLIAPKARTTHARSRIAPDALGEFLSILARRPSG
jgi:hypothetical protein